MSGREFRPPTEAQKKARLRNWRICKMRALYALSTMLTGWRRKVALFAIDAEIARLGAETQARRELRRLTQITEIDT